MQMGGDSSADNKADGACYLIVKVVMAFNTLKAFIVIFDGDRQSPAHTTVLN